MADLHEALKALAPLDWSDVPQADLASYVQHLTSQGDLICNSVPPPVLDPTSEDDTLPTSPNWAKSSIETKSTKHEPRAPLPEHETLQALWGKPVKFSAKDNPLGVAVFKMAGKDRHGAWFARRSIHQGIGFSKFRTAMLREFPQTLCVEGGPGAGSIRGIGGDKRLERINVQDAVKVEVIQLSAQFPGPTTPREFITMLITEESKADGHQGRKLILLSKPVNHPDAPDRQGYIHGQYESVEMIRELPQHESAAPEAGSHPQLELNPVEWIMITRSDPGGGIPRFMVDRGTPGAMLGDIVKFLDWATKIDETEHPDVDLNREEEQPADIEPTSDEHQPLQEMEPREAVEEPPAQPSGVFQKLTTALGSSIDTYAPTMVSSFVHDRLQPRTSLDSTSSDSSLISSADSFASAPEPDHTDAVAASDKADNNSMHSGLKKDSASIISRDPQRNKELKKIEDAKEKLEQRLAKKRQEEHDKLQKAQNDEQSESSKALERHNKEVKKQEDKHEREMQKLEAKRERELEKLEQKKRKQGDRDALQKVTRERDDFRSQVDLLKKENALLRGQIELLDSSTVSAAP